MLDFTSLRLFDCPVSTDVHVLVNGQEYFGATIGLDPSVNDGFFTVDGSYSGTPVAPKHFATTLPLQSGNTVDFIVGDGRNGYGCDSTGLSATIVKTNGVFPPGLPTSHPVPPVCK